MVSAIWSSDWRRSQHEHHDVVVSTMQMQLDHEHRFETVMLRGRDRYRHQAWPMPFAPSAVSTMAT